MTPWTIASLCVEFSRQEHWSELPFASPRDLPDPGIEPRSPALQADSLPLSDLGNIAYVRCYGKRVEQGKRDLECKVKQ